ncbi:Hypothetical protein DEACI_2326 [Acididesulfobacillus acetoxydans]|uniref:DUF1440 domain-containing protein n=1 Tax=Acididesulfobacillus acetoxydans TaxID=1561005 RepID=A0A8S0W899_9FIRM|nr:hypothetical protein [Acididesulfobacillus acetoxydans]CAA7601659.1 Hypothetical protein DEACI_2326 [Acididesulfobacillus acetoxydans]CEJ06325.1 Hypothetical protein DEACI_0773 [Acididesulfobacillus acetoxydans]
MMVRIKDRVLLGVAAGLGANAAKQTLDSIFRKLKWLEIDGRERAAGMLISPHKLAKKSGRLVGYIADNTVASLIGIGTVYALSVVGKEKAALKGAITGEAAWTGLYGVLGTMGATKVAPADPATVLSEFASHTVFGVLAATIASKLGDESLFNGSKPLAVFATKVQPDHQTEGKPVGSIGQNNAAG